MTPGPPQRQVLPSVWRYVEMAEVPALVRAAAGSAMTLLAFGGLLGLRVARRALSEREVRRRRAAEGGVRHRPVVLLVGAGAAGVMAVREIRSRGEHDMEMRGFVDDDPGKRGAVICGIRVLGSTEELPRLVPTLGIEQVIVTIAEAPEEEIHRILAICERIPVPVQMVPALYDLLQGTVSVGSRR